MMGSHRIHSASYHPQSIGMVVRFHRHLKSAIIAHEDTGWTDILNDKILPPLTPPYTGPHLVKSRSDKNFVICINNKNGTVPTDRCKPAFELSEDFNSQKGSSNFEPPLTKQQIEDKTVVDKNIRTTRSGRHVHFPKRLTY
ncbi:transposon Ty3-G Gag-Pol polyprotein [Trichonephila clavipes]|nr:transposon Ty3-G Gag-Pol polyprotein [Trichonephila clavipes]